MQNTKRKYKIQSAGYKQWSGEYEIRYENGRESLDNRRSFLCACNKIGCENERDTEYICALRRIAFLPIQFALIHFTISFFRNMDGLPTLHKKQEYVSIHEELFIETLKIK